MLDAVEGVSGTGCQDCRICAQQGQTSVLAVNKWDAVKGHAHHGADARKKVAAAFRICSMRPLCLAPAKTGSRLGTMFENIVIAAENAKAGVDRCAKRRVATTTARVQPPTDRGRRLKIYYITRVSVRPPTFLLFCNNAELFQLFLSALYRKSLARGVLL